MTREDIINKLKLRIQRYEETLKDNVHRSAGYRLALSDLSDILLLEEAGNNPPLKTKKEIEEELLENWLGEKPSKIKEELRKQSILRAMRVWEELY